jgi:hypothetical protein
MLLSNLHQPQISAAAQATCVSDQCNWVNLQVLLAAILCFKPIHPTQACITQQARQQKQVHSKGLPVYDPVAV